MFEGCYTAIVTPFKDGKVDESAFKNLIEMQLKNGIKGLIPCGTTGESPTLSFDEHKHVIDLTIKYVNKRAQVIAGSGSNSTQEAIELTEYAKKAGADAALVITPYYNKPTQRGLFLHFEAIAEEVDIPIVLYNVPGRTGVNLEADTIRALAEVPGIVAIKEASGSLDKVSKIIDKTNIIVLSGEDSLTFPMICIGAKGVISVTSNVVPDMVSKMVDCALKNDLAGAREWHKKIFNLSSKLFIETNPMPVKAALSMMGLINNELRLPLCPMSEDKRKILEEELINLNLISRNKN